MHGRTAFRLLWAGQTASVFGTAVSALAIPTIAIVALHATPLAVGLLGAVQFAAFPVLGLVAGVWVDRRSRRTIMLVADVIRALALATIPLAALAHVLGYLQLLIVAACVGSASAFFDVAYQSIVPAMVEPHELEGANARLEFTNSAAQIAGSGLAGGLIAAFGAPLAVAVDAASYLCSVISLAAMRVHETHLTDPGVAPIPFIRSLREGLRLVFDTPALVRIAGATATSNFGGSIILAVYLLYAYRVLHLSPALMGIVYAIGNLGFIGALFAPRIARRLGPGTTLIATAAVAGSVDLALPLARFAPIPILIAVQLVTSVVIPIYNITQVSLRQRLVTPAALGRMSATMRTLVWGTIPLGLALGGVLGQAIGIVPTLWVGAGLGLGTVLWLLGEPIRSLPRAPAPHG